MPLSAQPTTAAANPATLISSRAAALSHPDTASSGGTVTGFPVNDLAIAMDAFPGFVDRLRVRLGKEIFESWCSRLKLESATGTKLVFSVPTRFLKNWLQTHYAARILQCWQETHPGIAALDVIVRSPTAAKPVAQQPVQIETKRQAPSRLPSERPTPVAGELVGSPLDPRMTFENFAVGMSNRMAHAAAKLAAEGGDSPNPVYIHAACGFGKSHLLQAIAHEKKTTTLYVTAEHFIYSFTASIKANSPEFKNALRSIDTLLIDDIQFLKNKNTVSDLSLVLNSLIDSGRQVVIAGDRQPAHLEDIDDRLKSRLMGGMCVEIGAPDVETRRGILDIRLRHMQAQTANFSVPEPVLQMLAVSLTTSGRDLEGAMNQLLVHSRVDGGNITLEMAASAVQQLMQNQPPRRVKIEDIQKTVARHYGISKDDMISSRRTAQVVRPRQIAIYLAKLLTLRSLPEIGRRFGGRDHTTILHAVRKIESLLPNDPKMAKDVEDIRALLAA